MVPRAASGHDLSAAYDVVIVGGAIIGSAIAWFLTDEPGFDGRVLVVERDPTYEYSSTARTNSCLRQQFSNELNIRMSQFAVEYLRDFRSRLGGDPEVPPIELDPFGYLFLAADDESAASMRRSQLLQAGLGVGTVVLSPDEIDARFPVYDLDGIVCGSYNGVDEGYFDGATMFDWWRRKVRERGVHYVTDEVVAIETRRARILGVQLASGTRVACATVVNASGTRAARTAAMAGLGLPVEARKRYTFVFDAAEPLRHALPLTIDPSGVHVRRQGDSYLAGCAPDVDAAVDVDDFGFDHDIWEEKIWPTLARRIPAFERIKVTSRWVGHYATNTFDHNAIVGPHPELEGFIFANGFSGHGLQQAPAVGRGVAELIATGGFRTLDLSPFGYERLIRRRPFAETAII